MDLRELKVKLIYFIEILAIVMSGLISMDEAHLHGLAGYGGDGFWRGGRGKSRHTPQEPECFRQEDAIDV
jgi:hypothetical protein